MISWAHEPCNGTGWGPSSNATDTEGNVVRVANHCPGPHVGPFIVDFDALWADPDKVVWKCATNDVTCCSVAVIWEGHKVCGWYPVGERLEEAQ